MDTSSKLNTYYYCDVPEYPVLVYGTASTLFNNSLVCNYLLSHSKRFSPDTHFHSLLERSESLFFPVICGGNLGDLEIPGLVIAIDHCYILLNQRDGHDIRFPYDLKWKMLGTMKEQRALASMAPINETHFWITGDVQYITFIYCCHSLVIYLQHLYFLQAAEKIIINIQLNILANQRKLQKSSTF